MARDKKILNSFKGFIDDVEQSLGHKINPTTGGKSKNHKPGKRKQKNGKGALDLGRNDSGMQSDKDKRKVARIALRRGLNVGFESNHLHIDDNEDKLGRTFSRNTEGKKALKKSRELESVVKADHKKEIDARASMKFGSVDSDKLLSDFRAKNKTSIADIRKSDDTNTDTISNKQSSVKKPTLADKLKDISQIDPQGSNKQENIDAVLSNDPTKLVPQLTPSTPRLAMRQDQDGSPLASVQRRRNFEDEDIQKDKLSLRDKVKEMSKHSTEQEQIKGMQAAKEDISTQEQEVETYRQGEDIINRTDKKTINKQVDTFFGDDKENAADVKKDIQNKKAGKERKGGVTSQFTEALTFFLPQMLGGLLGGAIGGTDGALEGSQLSGQARDSFLAQQEVKKKSQLAQDKFDNQVLQKDEDQIFQEDKLKNKAGAAPKVDITPDFQHKTTGSALGTRENGKGGFEFIDDKGNVVPSSEAIKTSTFEANIRQEGIGGRQELNLDDKAKDRIDKSLKTFKTQPDITKTIATIDTSTPIVNLLESGMPVTGDFLAPFLARGVQGEVGNLSETDLTNARVPQAIQKKILSNAKGFFTGNMTDAERKATVRLLKYIQAQKRDQLKEKAMNYITPERAKRLGLTMESLRKQVMGSVGFKSKTKSIMTDKQRARREELKKKYNR